MKPLKIYLKFKPLDEQLDFLKVVLQKSWCGSILSEGLFPLTLYLKSYPPEIRRYSRV